MGTVSTQATLAKADAAEWGDLSRLLASHGVANRTVVVGRAPLVADTPVLLGFQPIDDGATPAGELDIHRRTRISRRCVRM